MKGGDGGGDGCPSRCEPGSVDDMIRHYVQPIILSGGVRVVERERQGKIGNVGVVD